jgi:transposase
MKLKKEKVIRINKNGLRYIVQPEHIKKQAVKELDEGKLSVKEAMEKYDVLSRSAIMTWLKTYSIHKDSYLRPARSTDAQRRQVVLDIEAGVITEKEASKQHNKSIITIQAWVRRYSNSTILAKKTDNMDTKVSCKDDIVIKLEMALNEARLKISSLETLIDITEQEYKFDIRKKFGTEQLK